MMPMFPSRSGSGLSGRITIPDSSLALTPQGVMAIVRRICQRAGVQDSSLSALRPHDLRRSFASMARDGGADLDTIKHAMGHSSMVTTERYLQQIQDLRLGRTAGDSIKVKTKRKRQVK